MIASSVVYGVDAGADAGSHTQLANRMSWYGLLRIKICTNVASRFYVVSQGTGRCTRTESVADLMTDTFISRVA
jgi:hypothetical protein